MFALLLLIPVWGGSVFAQEEPAAKVTCHFFGNIHEQHICYFDGERENQCAVPGKTQCSFPLSQKPSDQKMLRAKTAVGNKECFIIEKGKRTKNENYPIDQGSFVGENPAIAEFSFWCPDPCDTGGEFDAECLFPTWSTQRTDTPFSDRKGDPVPGIIGKNADAGLQGEGENQFYADRLLMFFLPTLIQLSLKVVAPIIAVMLVFVGLRFLYAGGDEEERSKSKMYFLYVVLGTIFIVLSYTIAKSLYHILSV